MAKKKNPAFTVKELLFAYLAISKLMYWMENVAAIYQDIFGEVWRMVLNRLLMQDIIIIWILVAMFFLDHYISTHPSVAEGPKKYVLVYGIGYVIYMASIVGYLFVLRLFIDVQIDSWAEILFSFSIFYAIASVMMYLKERMKKKEAAMYIPAEKINKDSLVLLATLRERGVLTQDEYKSKKEAIGNSASAE
ncbi:MAG: hypothetical protein FWB97_09240 [Oscillospiraceae bacterium]|nr:hypothetical protein [Oscillospiraceae bacterium]